MLILCGRTSAQQNEQGRGAVKATLIADTSAVIPGKPFRVGLYLRMLPGWHTYWQYPGDVGLPIAIKWKLPSGFHVGAFQWPIPKQMTLTGDIVDYGYEGETLLIAEVQPPAHFTAKEVVLRGDVSWLVCAKICVPGEANLSLTLPVAPNALPANAEIFGRFDRQLPAPCPTFPVTVSQSAGGIEITAQPGPEINKLSFYPLPAANQKIGKIAEAPPSDGQKWWTIKVPTVGNVQGVLVTEAKDGSRNGYLLNRAPLRDSVDVVSTQQALSQPTMTSPLTLFQGVLYGFLGGLILNLMPCVFPVISLKIFGFVRQAGEKGQSIFRHGLAFAAGVFTWFFILAGVIVLLRNQGHAANWAFQFQNPTFNFIILAIVFVFALNLLGVFEIYLPGSATTGLSRLGALHGLSGSFFQGVFATLLATPCTAPYLGAALGFAFGQSTTVIFLIFASVALGLALPYLLLSAQTGWMRFLPRPGAWMEWLKQFMAFPLLATAIWLLMILGSQRGLSAVVAALIFLLCLAFCCWLFGTFVQAGIAGWRRRLLTFVSLGIIVVAAFFTWPTRMDHTGGIAWRPYSRVAVQQALDAGKPVFVDFTADWCLTCKFNEKTAIERPAVIAAFRSQHIVAFKADWTKKNPEITEALRAFGRVGVPLYVFYPTGKPKTPVILPEILTESIVLKSLSVGK